MRVSIDQSGKNRRFAKIMNWGCRKLLAQIGTRADRFDLGSGNRHRPVKQRSGRDRKNPPGAINGCHRIGYNLRNQSVAYQSSFHDGRMVSVGSP
jgi:hypothetical protein